MDEILRIVDPIIHHRAMEKVQQLEDNFETFTDQHQTRIIKAGLNHKTGKPPVSNDHPDSHGNEVVRFRDGVVCTDGQRFTCTCRDFCQGLERYFNPGQTDGAPAYSGQVYCWHIWSVELFGVPKPAVKQKPFVVINYQPAGMSV